MSWHYSQALEAAFLAANSSDGEPSALSKSANIAAASSRSGKMTESSNHSQSGMMSAPSTENRGEELLTWFLEASRVRTLAQPEKGKVSLESEADSGKKCGESWTRYDLDSRSWKTRQFLLLGDLEPYLETWPKWGMMRNGGVFSAADVGARHERQRLFLLAGSNGKLRAPRPWIERKSGELEDEQVNRRKSDSDNERSFVAMAQEHLRMDDGIPYPVDGVTAIGNAQVPAVVRLAFEILSR